jgi:hypothetical protein
MSYIQVASLPGLHAWQKVVVRAGEGWGGLRRPATALDPVDFRILDVTSL